MWRFISHLLNQKPPPCLLKMWDDDSLRGPEDFINERESREYSNRSVPPMSLSRVWNRLCCDEVCQVRSDRNAKWSDAEIIGDCHRKNPVMRNNGSAYPECNKMGVWKSVKQTPQLRNYRNNEIRKLQGRIAKVVASASGQRKKKKVKK